MKKLLTAVLLALSLVTTASAQNPVTVAVPIAMQWDLDATGFTYPVTMAYPVTTPDATTRAQKVTFGYTGIPGNGKIQTSGLANTITATDSQGPFTALNVGDLILAQASGTQDPNVTNLVEGGKWAIVVITVKTNANSVDVVPAVNLTGGKTFYWRRFMQGGNSGFGWVPVVGLTSARWELPIEELVTDGAGINLRVECRAPIEGRDDFNNAIVWPSSTNAAAAAQCGQGAIAAADQSCVFTDAQAGGRTTVTSPIDVRGFAECRLGIRISVADDGADATPEIVDIYFLGATGASN